MGAAYARAARCCAHTAARGAGQDQAVAASLKRRSFDQNMNTTVQIIQLSKDHNTVRRYLALTDITDMCLNYSGTKRLGLGNSEAFFDLESSILFIRQQEHILLFLKKACTGPS